MMNVILPLISGLVSVFTTRRDEIAQKAGISADAVVKIGQIAETYLSKDQRTLESAMLELEKARQHDIKTQVVDIPLVNLMRGLVRPLTTFGAMGWYIYARLNDISLLPEDYAIIGGVLAFWFGFRPFEKKHQS